MICSSQTILMFFIWKFLLILLLIQDDYLEALAKLHLTVTKAYAVNPNIKFEVFIHKVTTTIILTVTPSSVDCLEREANLTLPSSLIIMSSNSKRLLVCWRHEKNPNQKVQNLNYGLEWS